MPILHSGISYVMLRRLGTAERIPAFTSRFRPRLWLELNAVKPGRQTVNTQMRTIIF